jgi:YegS/Rv2252/BmrU family lipid kinase
VDLVLTQGPGHALSLGRQAAEQGRSLVISAGGDGTLNETLNGIMQVPANGQDRPALAVLPVGRGNDFAFGLRIPADIVGACDTLVQNQRRRIDVGQVTGGDYPDGRYFGNGLGLGFDTVVGFEAAKLTHLHGGASYLVAVIRTIFRYAHAPVYEISIDDGEPFTQPFLMVSVMNGRRMGGAFMMAPNGSPHDGVLDLCLAGDISQINILPVAVTFMQGKQFGHPAVKAARANKVRIRAIEGSIPAHADGETVCTAGQELSVILLPSAIEVIVHANGEAG